MPKGSRRLITSLTTLPLGKASVHNGDYNGVASIFMGLSWELCCWRQCKWTLEQWQPILRSTPGQYKSLCCGLSLRNARACYDDRCENRRTIILW